VALEPGPNDRPGQPMTGYLAHRRVGPEHSTASCWPGAGLTPGLRAGTVVRLNYGVIGRNRPGVNRVGDLIAP
jgi:hypothetical protein